MNKYRNKDVSINKENKKFIVKKKKTIILYSSNIIF